MGLDPGQERAALRIVEELLALAEPLRRTRTDQLCGDDADLRRRVAALLAHATQRELDVVDGGVLEAILPEGPGAAPRSRIGSYELDRRLGEGGMGTVWLAHRADDEFRQRVAIKLVKRGMDTDAIVARFRRERQVLADLEHPCIARLLDGGATEDGRPYLVMEYVDGAPIDAWCDARGASIDERLSLFAGVCEAVQAAHERRVVHRDLKPANILVTASGAPKLLDFGIAKMLAEDDPRTELTLTGERLLTPRYASPEQVRGEPVSAATDVYALGIVLYELLTGRTPHEIGSGTASELESAVCDADPRRPSAAVAREPDAAALAAARSLDVTRLRRRLAGDLDTIVLRAMHKDPARRYASAAHLAADLNRHREGLPIHARRDTVGYCARKYVARNRVAVGAAAAVFAALVVGLVLTFREYRRAEDLLTEVRQQKAIADGVNEFLTRDVLYAAHPEKARKAEITMREVIDQAAASAGERFADAPLVEAAVRYALGETYFGFGLDARAEPQFRRALELRRRHLGEEHLDTMFAERDLAASLRRLGRTQEAIALYEPLLERLRRIAGADDGYTMIVANHLAMSYDQAERPADAEPLYRETLAARLRVFGEEHANTLTSINNLAVFLIRNGKSAEALPMFERALRLRSKLLGDDHPRTLISKGNLANTYLRSDRGEDAARLLDEVLEAQLRVIGPAHRHTLITAVHLAHAYTELGQIERAEAALRRAFALASEHHGGAPLRQARARLVDGLLRRDKFAEAEPLLHAALDDAGKTAEDEKAALRGLIRVYEATDRPALAAPLRDRL